MSGFIKKVALQGEEGKEQLSVGIPREIQRQLDLQEGDYLYVEKTDGKIYLEKLNKGDRYLNRELREWEIDYHQDAMVEGIKRNEETETR